MLCSPSFLLEKAFDLNEMLKQDPPSLVPKQKEKEHQKKRKNATEEVDEDEAFLSPSRGSLASFVLPHSRDKDSLLEDERAEREARRVKTPAARGLFFKIPRIENAIHRTKTLSLCSVRTTLNRQGKSVVAAPQNV